MKWTRGPLRNTTGHSIGGSAIIAAQRNSTAPRQDGWRAHHAPPGADSLGARVDHADRGLSVETAKHYVSSCQEAIQRQQPLPRAKTRGRCASFFKAAAQTVGGCVGIGTGRTPHAEAGWERPDRPAPPRLAKSRAPAGPPSGDDSLALRQAANEHHQLQRQTEHLGGVQALLRTGLAAAQDIHTDALRESSRCLRAHSAASAALAAAGEDWACADRHRHALGSALRDATTAVRSQESRQQAMLARLRELGGHGEAVSLDDIGRTLAVEQRRVRAQGTLQDCDALLAGSREALRAAQATAAPAPGVSGGTAASAHQAMLLALQGEHDRHQGLRDRAWTQVQRLGSPAPALNHDERARLLVAAQDGAQALLSLRQQRDDLAAQRDAHEPEYDQARRALADAQRLENAADERRDLANSRLEGARQNLRGLEGQAEVLRPLVQALDGPRHAAHARVTLLEQAQRNQQAAKLERLFQRPPGFEQAAPSGLGAALRALGGRLQANAAQTPSTQRWPIDDTLEAVSRALALVSGGDADLAGRTLDDLMRRPLAALVPPPGQWFDGSPRQHGQAPPPPGALERLVGQLGELPCGAELLARLAAPGARPPDAALKDAVAVYHQAARAMASAETGDSASWLWLHAATMAASHHGHPATPPVALNTLQLSAYNGVRNGLLSVCAGSAYDQANRQLATFADEWAANQGRHNPLKARRKAALVATQVGLPTPIRQSNQALLRSCDQLRQVISEELVKARREAAVEGRMADAARLEPLLEAAGVLRYIEKHADGHLRLDQMRLGRKAWRSVDRRSQRWLAAQARPAAVPAALQAEVRRLGLTPAPGTPAATLAEGEPGPWHDLSFGLLELRVDKKSTALQALRKIQEQLGQASAPPEPGGARLPTIEEAEEPGDDAAQDERDAIVEQGARDLAPAAGQLPPRHPGVDETREALDRALALQPRIDAFMKPKDRASVASLESWIAPVVSDHSSSLSMGRGHSVGVGISGVSAAVSKVAGHLGVVARVDAEATLTRMRQLRWSRQSRGMELFAGQNKQVQGRGGFTGGVGYAFISLPSDDAFSVGAVGSWSVSRSRADTRGVLLRSPKYADKPQAEVTQDFGDMVHTVLHWKDWRDAQGEPAYASPMQALLSRHPQASVGTIEQLRTVATITRSGVTAAVSGGGPMFAPLSGAVSLGAGLVSETKRERTRLKTAGGAQGFSGSTAGAAHTVSAQAGYTGQLGGNVSPAGAGNAAVRGRTSTAMLQVDLYRKQLQSSTTLVRQPDGTLVGEKATEFNTYEAFEAEVRPHWDAWIEHGVNKGHWPEAFPATDRRLLVERELQDFMAAAEHSLRNAGTVTLNQTLDIRSDVCAELSACLALQELAQAQGRPDEAAAMHRRSQRLLASDASYTPYKLKAVVRSQVETGIGVDAVLTAMRRQSASAAHEYDSFPKG